MFFGKHTIWRLLSPFGALLCAFFIAGFAGPALADGSSGHGAAEGAAAKSQASDHSSTQSSDTEGADFGSGSSHAVAPVRSASSDSTPHGGASDHGTSPQPLSTADLNTGGANGQCGDGPYCATQGGASANGNGGGKAVNRPDAGTVGKADNKNPKGQMPGGSDHNAGYECDTNHGIARGNPAHTGCVGSEPGCVTGAPECPPNPSCENTPALCPPNPSCENTPALCPPNPSCENTPAVCPPNPSCENTPALCPPNPSCENTAALCPSSPTCENTPALCPQLPGSSVEAPILGSAAPTASSPPSGTASSGVLPETGASDGLVGQAAVAVLTILAGIGMVAARRRTGPVS